MMFKNKYAEKLYELAPDILYQASDGTWYAAYHKEMTILTNANKIIAAYKYRSKQDYQDVRKLIIGKYKLNVVKIKYSEY